MRKQQGMGTRGAESECVGGDKGREGREEGRKEGVWSEGKEIGETEEKVREGKAYTEERTGAAISQKG